MPFRAEILPIQPPARLRIKRGMLLKGSPNSLGGNLSELVDRVESTTHAAATAPRGVSSKIWQGFIANNPGIEDPFTRVVQAAPDIADATSRTFINKLMGEMERGGLTKEVAKLAEGLEEFYAPQDPNGNPCSYDAATGSFFSKSGLKCELVKVSGGGLSFVKNALQKASPGLKEDSKKKLDQAVETALREVVKGPQRLWSKLSSAWKSTLLLAGLAAATPRITGLKLEKGNIKFQIPPGVGSFSGGISISGGKLRGLSINLPPVTRKGLKLTASGEFSQSTGKGQVAVVVPVKKATVGVTVTHEQGRKQDGYYHQSTLETQVGRPIGKGGGKIEAGTKTTFVPGQRTPTEYSLQLSTPVGQSKSVALSAGVTGTVTTSGRRVELAGNPAVTASISGKLPTLNRRLRKAQQYEKRKEEEARTKSAELKQKETELVASLQSMDSKTEEDAMWELESQLRDVRRQLGSANRAPEATINGDLVTAAVATLGIAALTIKSNMESI
jgi:hypothetical protein